MADCEQLTPFVTRKMEPLKGDRLYQSLSSGERYLEELREENEAEFNLMREKREKIDKPKGLARKRERTHQKTETAQQRGKRWKAGVTRKRDWS